MKRKVLRHCPMCIFSELQQRLPNELLSGLASSIASGMIYEIIQGLTDIQQGTEKHLFHQRLELLKKQSGERAKSTFSK